MTFDKLAHVDRLRAAGFDEPQARAMADGLDQALREEVATRTHLAALRNEFGLLRIEFESELGAAAGALRGEMGALRGDLLAAVKADKVDLLKWVVMLIVGQTAILTALKLLGR